MTTSPNIGNKGDAAVRPGSIPNPDADHTGEWENAAFGGKFPPEAAALAKLAGELFATLPGQTAPTVTGPASPGQIGSPALPPPPAAGLPGEAELRALPGALTGATAPSPLPIVPTPAPVFVESPSFYFLDSVRATPPRAVPALNLAPRGGLDPASFGGHPVSPGNTLPGDPSVPNLPAAAASPAVAAAPASGTSLYFLDDARSFARTPATPPAGSTEFRPETLAGLASAHPAFDVHAVRRDFPILEERVHGRPLVWLDNAATTQKPQAVIDRLAYFYRHENSNIHRGAHELAARATDAYEAARDKAARFLHAASSDEIVFVRGASEAINLVAQSWGRRHIGKDDEIVITWLEHHANIVPWQQLCLEVGARLRVAPVDDLGRVMLDEYEKLLGPRTRLVAFSQVSNALGTVTPAREMIEIAHRYGARVLVDGAQAVSHLRVDVQTLDSDWYVFSGHKVFGPTGIGVLYGKLDLLNTMPPWQGGGNMIRDVSFEQTLYQPAPARFEAGTGNIADAVGLGAALDYLERIGLENVSRYEHELLLHATRGLAGIPGLRIIGTAPDKAGVISFVLEGIRSEAVGEALNREGIAVRSGHHCAQPILRRFGVESTVRPSLALYNTREEIDALVVAVRRIGEGSSVLRY
ncbi:cysteine desulfurase [Methylocaldum marinum]|uniref:cysteine desulfurase n=1 Tax=Methylocaldum marinum TaxID=1432792 RepID=A0A250KZM9_9GAMM|nr:family 2A encapsulin nanocompartment cargo protein cysteine desulfurase [Methylocaldum marinum]BBA37090.1 cysteine desulfurase [Methylocaldum marinum]